MHIIYVHSHQQHTYLLLDRQFQLLLLLIYEIVIHWILTHMTPQAYIQLVVCLLYIELHITALGDSLGLCRSPVQMKAILTLMTRG